MSHSSPCGLLADRKHYNNSQVDMCFDFGNVDRKNVLLNM